MDFEAWLAAPHPPTEVLLEASHTVGLIHMKEFVDANSKTAAWYNFLQGKSRAGLSTIATRLPDFYEARDACEIAHAKYAKAIKYVEAGNYALGLLQKARDRARFDYSDTFPPPIIIPCHKLCMDRSEKSERTEHSDRLDAISMIEGPPHLIPLLVAIHAAQKTVDEYACERDRASKEWIACIRRQGVLESQIFEMFDL